MLFIPLVFVVASFGILMVLWIVSDRRAAHQICERLLHGSEQPARLLISIRGDNVDTNHRIGMVQLLRWPELFAVDLQRIEQRVGSKMGCKGVRQSERCGQFSTEGTRSENPDRNLSSRAGHRTNWLTVFSLAE